MKVTRGRERKAIKFINGRNDIGLQLSHRMLLLLLGVFLISTYNGLVKLRQRVQNAWSRLMCNLRGAMI